MTIKQKHTWLFQNEGEVDLMIRWCDKGDEADGEACKGGESHRLIELSQRSRLCGSVCATQCNQLVLSRGWRMICGTLRSYKDKATGPESWGDIEGTLVALCGHEAYVLQHEKVFIIMARIGRIIGLPLQVKSLKEAATIVFDVSVRHAAVVQKVLTGLPGEAGWQQNMSLPEPTPLGAVSPEVVAAAEASRSLFKIYHEAMNGTLEATIDKHGKELMNIDKCFEYDIRIMKQLCSVDDANLRISQQALHAIGHANCLNNAIKAMKEITKTEDWKYCDADHRQPCIDIEAAMTKLSKAQALSDEDIEGLSSGTGSTASSLQLAAGVYNLMNEKYRFVYTDPAAAAGTQEVFEGRHGCNRHFLHVKTMADTDIASVQPADLNHLLVWKHLLTSSEASADLHSLQRRLVMARMVTLGALEQSAINDDEAPLMFLTPAKAKDGGPHGGFASAEKQKEDQLKKRKSNLQVAFDRKVASRRH